MKRYAFTITISAWGPNPDEAWQEAVMALAMKPGSTPDKSEYAIEEEE